MGVDGPRFANSECADGNASGHLRNGEEGVEALEGFGFDGDAEDGENGFCGGHAGEMRGAAGSRDNDFDTALFGVGGVIEEQIRGAMGGNYFRFMWNTEVRESF